MFANRFTAVIDACVLADVAKRDLILSLAEAGLFRPRWSDRILQETHGAIANILSNDPTANERAERAISAIRRAFPESEDEEYKKIESTLSCLPDPDDHHVLAVAITCKASVIVTDNIADFPKTVLSPYGLETKSGDDFIADSIDLDYPKSVAAINKMRGRLSRPSLTAEDLIEAWRKRGMLATVEALSPHVHLF